MSEAKRKAGKIPKRILTDKLAAYIDGIERVFGAETEHIQSKPFAKENSTNIIERFQGTLKDRTKVVRGFKNMDTARLLTEAWLVHYNFFKEHTTLGDIPPAVKMGVTPIKDWADVVTGTKTIPYSKPRVKLPRVARLKQKHPKRKPKGLKRRVFTEVSLSTMKIK